MTKDLYTVADVKQVRESLLESQRNKCGLTGQVIPPKQAVLDHKHDSEQLVRAVLHRQGNAVLGKIENLWNRYLSYWYEGTLSDFLIQVSEYLEKEHSKEYRHPGWIKFVKARFNQLNAKQKDFVLKELGWGLGKNEKERKEIFSKLVMDRSLGYNAIFTAINNAKEVL